ncbi:MAG: cobalamin-binding protein, partial [Defluviitaleaceae bacterium]|nr:cobalamin-binding protein [Defluviitaleaceae bacterium]
LLARFVDLADAAGIRDNVRLAIGGMAIRPELAQELGFDAGFGPDSGVADAVAFVEGREYVRNIDLSRKREKDFTQSYSYTVKHGRIKELLGRITPQITDWADRRTSPGITRAALRESLWDAARWRTIHEDPSEINSRRSYEANPEFTAKYPTHCGETLRGFYENGNMHPKLRRLTRTDVEKLTAFVDRCRFNLQTPSLLHRLEKPIIFNQYGTGCPYMDVAHIKVSEAHGVDGVVHFDPSWGARTEGFYDGHLTHQEDGTVITPANLNRVYRALEHGTLWQVRAHRGLNTPETVVLAGKIGANLTKINICYGSLGAGTDPARMTVDAVAAIRYAARYNMPFDIVTNEELCGVPAHKAFAGMLIGAHLGAVLGGRPILQPLFAYSPEVMLGKQMEDNYIDFNAAKVLALRSIIDAPIWPGAPIGFLTHTEDRVQSSTSTAFHAGLAAVLGVDAISVASSDEAYSGGPITSPSRVDTLLATREAFRFFGHTSIEMSRQATQWAEKLVCDIEAVLEEVATRGDFVAALYEGLLGSKEDGAYPGRAGQGTVELK